MNCCVCPSGVVAAAGLIASAAVTVTTVEVTWPLPSVAVAVTVHEPVAEGAVYRPVVAPIEPHEAAQVAPVLAVNCWLVPAGSVGLSGVMVSADVVAAVMVSKP